VGGQETNDIVASRDEKQGEIADSKEMEDKRGYALSASDTLLKRTYCLGEVCKFVARP
jgi:hypothetical protein